MLDLLATPPLQVFSILGAFVGLLLLLELGLMLIGLSSDLGLGHADGPGVDAGVLSADAALAQVDAAMIGSLDPASLTDQPQMAGSGSSELGSSELGSSELGSVVSALGLGAVPFVLWLAILCGTIAAQGFFLQILLVNATGWMLPAVPAVVVTLPGAVWLTRRLSLFLGRMIPQSESYVISARSFNRRRGTVVVGTARAGSPAEVRFSDSFGTLHYILCEPLDRADAIAAGTPVVILRNREGKPRIVALQ